MDQAPVLAPVAAEERIAIIDVLRGAALFGILAANMRGFFGPASAYFAPHLLWKDAPDRIVTLMLELFINGKFITIFATLFGIGFAIQMDRAAAAGRGLGTYARRLAVLCLFGLLHSFGIWWGDILLSYGLMGFALMLFRTRSQRTVWWWAHGLYWWPALMFTGAMIAKLAGHDIPMPPEPTKEAIEKTIAIYSSGTIQQIFLERAREWRVLNGGAAFFFPRILGWFLFGLYIWRQGFLRDPGSHLAWWRKARGWGLSLGLAGNAAGVAIIETMHPNMFSPSPASLAIMLVLSAGIPALSLGYAATVVLWFQKDACRHCLMRFAYVGRMALTNYLLQSAICTTLFYSYGGALFGKIGPLIGLLPTVLIYGLQIPFSRWWLSSRRYGPMERLWRLLTYGRPPETSPGA